MHGSGSKGIYINGGNFIKNIFIVFLKPLLQRRYLVDVIKGNSARNVAARQSFQGCERAVIYEMLEIKELRIQEL